MRPRELSDLIKLPNLHERLACDRRCVLKYSMQLFSLNIICEKEMLIIKWKAWKKCIWNLNNFHISFHFLIYTIEKFHIKLNFSLKKNDPINLTTISITIMISGKTQTSHLGKITKQAPRDPIRAECGKRLPYGPLGFPRPTQNPPGPCQGPWGPTRIFKVMRSVCRVVSIISLVKFSPRDLL